MDGIHLSLHRVACGEMQIKPDSSELPRAGIQHAHFRRGSVSADLMRLPRNARQHYVQRSPRCTGKS